MLPMMMHRFPAALRQTAPGAFQFWQRGRSAAAFGADVDVDVDFVVAGGLAGGFGAFVSF